MKLKDDRKARKKSGRNMTETQMKEEMERLALLCIGNEVMTKRALNVRDPP